MVTERLSPIRNYCLPKHGICGLLDKFYKRIMELSYIPEIFIFGFTVFL